jgi:hypothetical protein
MAVWYQRPSRRWQNMGNSHNATHRHPGNPSFGSLLARFGAGVASSGVYPRRDEVGGSPGRATNPKASYYFRRTRQWSGM